MTAKISDIAVQVAGISDWRKKTEKEIENVQKSIDMLSENFVSEKDVENFAIYIRDRSLKRIWHI